MRRQDDIPRESPLTVDVVAAAYTHDVNSARSHIRIFAGECNPSLYSHASLVDAFRSAKRGGVHVQVIASPLLAVVVSNGKAHSGLIDLAEEGVITLFRRDCRGTGQHYRVIDDSVAVVEDYHEPLALLSDRSNQRHEGDVGKWISDFDSYISDERAVPSHNPLKDFLIVGSAELQTLKDFCGDQHPGVSFSSLSRNDITECYKQLSEVRSGKKSQVSTVNSIFA
jgi:hypothetical protein